MAHLTRFTIPAEPGPHRIAAHGFRPLPVAVEENPAGSAHLTVWAEVEARPAYEPFLGTMVEVVHPGRAIPAGYRYLGMVTRPGTVRDDDLAVYVSEAGLS